MEKVNKHQGFICVCAECGSIIRTIGLVPPGETPLLSHGICVACAEKLYGEFFRGAQKARHAGDSPTGGTVP